MSRPLPLGFVTHITIGSAALIALIDPVAANAQQTEPALECIEQLAPQMMFYGEHTEGCSIEEDFDIDRFQFDGKEGEGVRIYVHTLTNHLDLGLEVRGPDGMILDLSSCVGQIPGGAGATCGFIVDLTGENALPKTGSYHLAVKETQDDEQGAYLMNLERIPPLEAPPVVPYDSLVFDGISPGTDIDFFTFVANPNTEVHLALASKTNNFDPTIEVFDPDGHLFVTDSCEGRLVGGDPAKCQLGQDLFPDLAGTYIALVRDTELDESGEYEISLQCDFPPLGCPFSTDSIADSFGTYRSQVDDVGELIDGKLVYSIRAQGAAGEAVVANASGPLASFTAIEFEDGEDFWVLGSSAGMLGEDRVLITGNLPGITNEAKTGPFASFFQNPQNLMGAVLVTSVRGNHDMGVAAAQSRAVAAPNDVDLLTLRLGVVDESGNMALTAPRTLEPNCKTVAVKVGPGSFTPPPDQPLDDDYNQITGDFFQVGSTASPGTPVAASKIDICDVLIMREPCEGLDDLDGDCVPNRLDNCENVIDLAQEGTCEDFDADVRWNLGPMGPEPGIDPPHPGPSEDILFMVGSMDTYGNACEAAAAYGLSGNPKVIVDPVAKTIEVAPGSPVDHLDECDDSVLQVTGITGSFGPLEPGHWRVFTEAEGMTLDETFIVPEPARFWLNAVALGVLGMLARRRM